MRRIITIISAAVASLLVGGVAFACVTNGINSSAQCGVQITWTAYLNSGDTPDWGTATMTKPVGVQAAPTNTSGVAFTTTTFVPGTDHAETWYITETATQGYNHGTTYYASQYVDAYSHCNPTPGPTVTITDTPAPSPTVTVTATPPTIVVTKTPKPVTVVKYKTPKQPRAAFEGPCGDPFYRVREVNPTKHSVTFRFSYTSFKTGKHAVVVRRVPAGRVAHTPYVHVLGSTEIMVKDGRGQILDAGLASAPGDYKVCRV